MQKSRLELKTAKATFSLSLTEALLKIWFVLTYPLTVAVGYYVFGWQGAVAFGLFLILNFRGRL